MRVVACHWLSLALGKQGWHRQAATFRLGLPMFVHALPFCTEIVRAAG